MIWYSELLFRTYYADTTVADNMSNFANKAYQSYGVSVNNTFRLEDSSQIKTKNTKAEGLSRHQAGFAIDLNGVGNLTPKELKGLNKLAAENGLHPLSNQKGDLPHFSEDPTAHGYKSLKQAVDTNINDYKKPKFPLNSILPSEGS